MDTSRSNLCQAESLANRATFNGQGPEQITAIATCAIAFALVAIGQELVALNAKRLATSDPAADCQPQED